MLPPPDLGLHEGCVCGWAAQGNHPSSRKAIGKEVGLWGFLGPRPPGRKTKGHLFPAAFTLLGSQLQRDAKCSLCKSGNLNFSRHARSGMHYLGRKNHRQQLHNLSTTPPKLRQGGCSFWGNPCHFLALIGSLRARQERPTNILKCVSESELLVCLDVAFGGISGRFNASPSVPLPPERSALMLEGSRSLTEELWGF